MNIIFDVFFQKTIINIEKIDNGLYNNSFIEIVDGNVKMTLGLIWTIILRFAIQDINVEGYLLYLICTSIINNEKSNINQTILRIIYMYRSYLLE